jgi:hypothetical protein
VDTKPDKAKITGTTTASEQVATTKAVKIHPAAGVAVGDEVRLRKAHPCGSFDWRVVRIGADIGLRCIGCDHRVTLARAVFEKRFKSFLTRQNEK